MRCDCQSPILCVVRGSSPNLLARLRKSDGSAVVAGDLAAIAWARTNATNPSDPAQSGALAAGSAIVPLAADPLWTIDGEGRNFAWQAPASLFASAEIDDVVRVDVTLTPTAGQPIVARWMVRVG